ncbi:MAG TPA: helix-turn-helix domain-containing protein [Polyangiaceae bacterium]|nr:helix-turn-helix domain-containing protein [Polyangiaceae bacterium]
MYILIFCVTNGKGDRRLMSVTNPGDLMLLEEVAAVARVSAETVRYWIKQGRLASVRPGQRRMVRREDLEAFLYRTQGGRMIEEET